MHNVSGSVRMSPNKTVNFLMLKKLYLLPLAALLVLTGCSTAKLDPYQGFSAEHIYAMGHRDLQTSDYTDAITAYQSLDSQYPFNPLTQKGDLETIYAEYEADNPALAMTAAARYTKIYPNGPHLDYAYYMMGVIDFENGRGFLQKYFPYNMSQHDAENYVNAFNYFAMVVNTYPNSSYAPDARRRMIFLNNTIAQFQMNVAEMNYQRKAYVAAINRAQDVLLHYPTSPHTEEALKMMVQSYQALGLDNLAKTSSQVLLYNFPHASE